MRIIVSGGGTGGHISPVLAVIEELNKIDDSANILYIGSKEGLEKRIVPQLGIRFKAIKSGKFRRYYKNLFLNIINPFTLFKNIKDAFRFVSGYFEARLIIREFDPDVVFCKGGYVTLPVGLAAHHLGYPIVIHESDSIMGLSNKILAKYADMVCVAYEKERYPMIENEKLMYTGNPVRTDVLGGSRLSALEKFGLDGKLPIILIIGGSQGSSAINNLIFESLKDLLKKYQLLHISGEIDYDWLKFQSKKLPAELAKNYSVYNFLSKDLEDAYSFADLVISRASNNVIAELAALKKPAILIPLPGSANNHQLSNAKILSRNGAVLVMLQEHLTVKKLVRQIDLLFENPEEMKSLASKLNSTFVPDSAKIIAENIIILGKDFSKEKKEYDQNN
jgi:UDP-N-acetylglucosamine--N-acetylmuramyl-(pentapeptide) pyrophosphoryl-undecaprenol N-acetylglucosamine transferase